MWTKVVNMRSQYQLIELFHDPETGHLKLELNGCLQFHSADEYRYHEFAIHSAVLVNYYNVGRITILGGGDGLACREALKIADSVTIVDIDKDMTELAKNNELLKALNKNAMNDKRVKIINMDAFKYALRDREKAEIVFCDYPDPTSPVLGKLYTKEHYQQIKDHLLRNNGVLIVQSGGALMYPFMAYMGNTLASIFKQILFAKVEMINGIQGFIIASDEFGNYNDWSCFKNIDLKAFNNEMFWGAIRWSKDQRQQLSKVPEINDPYLVYVYSLAWMEYLSGNRRM